MSAPLGRPEGRSQGFGAAQRRTGVTPSLGEGAGGWGAINSPAGERLRSPSPGEGAGGREP